MSGDLTERLLAHFVGGHWRAPLSERMLDLPGGGRIVCANASDAVRAVGLCAPDAGVLIWQAAHPEAAVIARVHDMIATAGGCILLPAPALALAALRVWATIIATTPVRHDIALLQGDALSQAAFTTLSGISRIDRLAGS